MLALTGLSGAFSLAVTLDTSQPEIAQRAYGDLPKAKSRLADLTIARAFADQTAPIDNTSDLPSTAAALARGLAPDTLLGIERLALSSLIDTPYNSEALRLLAFIEEDEARRRRLLQLSRQLSRRDVNAAAQVAELQLLDGDLAGGLATLDRALIVSDDLDQRLFPLLLNASRLPEFMQVLRPALARDPPWAERLAAHASANTASAVLFAPLVSEFPATSRVRALDYGQPLVERLAGAGQIDAAFEAYDAYAGRSQDPADLTADTLAPLDWQLIDEIEVGARTVGAGDRDVELFANPRRSGDVGMIVTRLSPGSYVFTLALDDPRGDGGQIILTRRCIASDASIAESQAALSGDRAQLRFAIPTGCETQALQLSLEAGPEGIDVLVPEATLRRLLGNAGPEAESAS